MLFIDIGDEDLLDNQFWHSSLTKTQSHQIERIQKRTCKLILGNNYHDYESALRELNITSLDTRREELVLKFGQHVLNSEKHNNNNNIYAFVKRLIPKRSQGA